MNEENVRYFGGADESNRKKVRIIKEINENTMLIETWDYENDRWSGRQETCNKDMLFK